MKISTSIMVLSVLVSILNPNPVTPAPTIAPPEVPENGCPDDSIPSSLEISLVWTEDTDLDLHVFEPGGGHVYYGERLGDVGIMSDDNVRGPGNETYTLLNGLNIDEDEVLGTYRAWITNGREGTPWTMTARLAGELEWAISGVISGGYSSDDYSYDDYPFYYDYPVDDYSYEDNSFDRYSYEDYSYDDYSYGDYSDDDYSYDEYSYDGDRTFYPVTLTKYTESTCDIDLYGTCPEGSFSDDGTPPCVVCPNGRFSQEGSSTCSPTALLYVDASDELLATMEADAIGGFAGPGYFELDGDSSSYSWDLVILNEDDAGVFEVTGTFERDVDGDASLPSSTALFVYLELEDESFMRGEGSIDPSTGEFTATVMNVPEGFGKVFYSFVVLDPEEAVVIDDGYYADSVFYSDVISLTCPSPLTITLEWSTDNSDFDMEITEPDGSSWYAWDIGTYGFGSGDVTDGFGPEVWTVLPGNPEAVGTYTVRLYFLNAPGDTEWTLTARVNGEIEWIETGIYEPNNFGFSYSYYSYDSSSSDLFSVTLDSVDTEEC